MRLWDIGTYSEAVQLGIHSGRLSTGSPYDEWALAFI